jgi:hypothetical protein
VERAVRDTLRKSQNKLGIDPVSPGELARRCSGSSDLFEANGRRPWHSINFMVAHDGFTLADLYHFNTKNNQQPCPFGPSDGGTDDNSSWDQGGTAEDQRKAARNGLAFLMLSASTPMITGGDEFLRTLQGNNNPYNLDTVANWLNFEWDAYQTTFHTFAKRLLAFRLYRLQRLVRRRDLQAPRTWEREVVVSRNGHLGMERRPRYRCPSWCRGLHRRRIDRIPPESAGCTAVNGAIATWGGIVKFIGCVAKTHGSVRRGGVNSRYAATPNIWLMAWFWARTSRLDNYKPHQGKYSRPDPR